MEPIAAQNTEAEMAGLASKRCDVCGQVALLSDRGIVHPVGHTRVISHTPGVTRAICACGQTVNWRRSTNKVVELPGRQPHPLAEADPGRLAYCMSDGHVPLNDPGGSEQGKKLMIAQNVCTRCGTVYATVVHI